MKMPPAAAESTDNGIYEYQESSLSITAEEIENVEVNDFEAPPENDFSEYMWMEHEEEFDKEVMQRLEEEALMEECIAYMSSENASFQNPADGQVEIDSVVNSKLNPEAAEFIPATQRKPSEEQPSDSNESS
ncbi:hypothetical protein ABEB36_011124 [Hypothenemus hampei]|uniref:Ataxin-2 C-terminal domain-containing protein n=1 Tax=Hypothenemus hampei TaxID=57062 RepID=A0ABD1EE99_HYPHA